jgi:hypothetical protein
MEKVYFRKDFSAGWLNKSDGNSYCHCVWRTYSTWQRGEFYHEIDIQELYDSCPLTKEEIDKVLESGAILANVFEDIYNGKDTNKEWWEYNSVKLEKSSKDGAWYENDLYKNAMARFKKAINAA